METDVTQTSQTDMQAKVADYSVDFASPDEPSISKKTPYTNPDFVRWYGYYKKLPELKKGIDAFATWALGKGYEAKGKDKVELENLRGRGEEDFLAIMWNMLVMKKVNGDSYAEIIRNEENTLINLKPLNPSNIAVWYNSQGLIEEYEDIRTGKKFPTNKILHFSNDRTANEMGGTSVIPVVKFTVDAKNEAMEGYRRILHRSTIRVLYVDEDDKTRLSNLKRDYAEAMNKGELLVLPFPEKDGKFADLITPPVQSFLEWIRYLDNQIFLDIGTPKVIMGSVDSIPESGGKISYLSYEQIYKRETRELEADLLNQLGVRVTFTEPASIAEGVTDEADKNQAQTGFQPNDTKAGAGK